MKIPFVDLKIQYQNHKTELDKAIADVIAETAFVGGSSNKYINKFEAEFASFLGIKNIITCANGTDSLEILLEAYNIKLGDEVIIPAISWISTSEAVGRTGAKPVFIDVCEDTLLMDLSLLESKITKATKAIMPVHLYGNAVDMEEIMRIAKKYNLIVIEDCAQSHGATFNGKLTGTFGNAASYSFYPGKNLGAYGDAGAIATNDNAIAQKCRMIANHGQLKKHDHVMEGRNSRMDGIHAAILSVKLNYLNEWNNKRIKNANKLSSLISKDTCVIPTVNPNAKHVFHLYVIRHSKRDELKNYLGDKGIETAIHYPNALPYLKAYEYFNYLPSDFPTAFYLSKQILSLPIFPEMTEEQIKYVVNVYRISNKMSYKNAIIVCWDFPPHHGIGGRRWSKIAKSLQKLNFNISVITSVHEQKNMNSTWITSKELSKMKLYYFKSCFLANWINDYSSLGKSLKIRIASLLLGNFYKGTIYDKAIGIENPFLDLIEKVIRSQSAQIIFVTGAPFNLVYYVAKFKKKFPQIKIIADYRDPWINAQNYGMKDLNPKKKRQELEKQNFVFEQIDYVTAPNEFLLKEIKDTYTGKNQIKTKFLELPHAFDPDDVIKVNRTRTDDKIRIVYAGTLYLEIDEHLKFLNEAIKYISALPGNIPIEVVFFTNEIEKKELFEGNNSVFFSKPINEKIFEEINSSDAVLILLSEHNKNYVTSKFYEFLPYRKPYLYVGPKGYVSEKIQKEKLGYVIERVSDLHEILIKDQKHKILPSVNIDKYTFDVVTSNLLSNISSEI